MSNVSIEKQKLDVLATAISNKSGVPVTMTLDQMVNAVDNIQTGGSAPVLQTKSATYTPTESQQTETITPDSGYDGLEQVNVTVSAMPTGTAGTPTATKGSVSNHSVTVTPSVTNTTGYISGGTKTGTAVTVTASELTSGSETKTANGSYDVTNLQTLVVNVSGGGGASNFVTGTFTTPSTTATNGTVTVPYTGTGYPIALIIFVEGGCYNADVSGWYNSMTRYAVGQYCITKANTPLAPTYGTSGSANLGTVQLLFKSSSSSATSYSSTRSIGANSYSSSNANGTSTTSVRWRSNTLISYRTAGGTSSTYGLLADTTYRYIAVYSQ